MKKKIVGLTIGGLLILVAVFGFAINYSTHGIPNGRYAEKSGASRTYALVSKGDYADYYWRIRGNKATWYASSQKSSVYKIIKKDGRIYFQNEERKHEVEYDKTTKSITFVSTTVT